MENEQTKNAEIIDVPAQEVVENETMAPAVSNVDSFIAQALATGAPIETLERLLAMRTQLKAEAARDAFARDMATLQQECPTIEKSKSGGKTKSGMVAYKYAPLGSIAFQVKDVIGRNGFSYSFRTEVGTNVKAICIVKHYLGHTEETPVEVPMGAKTDIMSAPQVVAATMTFAKRYAFCDAFGISVSDEDNEANLQEDKFIDAAMDEYKDKLRMATNSEELKGIFVTLPVLAKKELQQFAAELNKSLLSGEEPVDLEVVDEALKSTPV